jgi:TolB protein
VSKRLYLLLLAVTLACLDASAAYAAFPGTNGKIAFSTGRDANVAAPFNFELYTINPDGTVPTRLTNDPAFDYGPAWSPDGAKIAFTTDRGTGIEDVYVMNADGTGPANLTNNAASDLAPAWSPDGTKIAFSTERDGNFEIYSMNADGTGQTRLTNNAASDFNPAWSPDGTKIAFDRTQSGGDSEVYTINANGTSAANITNMPASDDAAPTWSPDGTRIAFYTDRDGNYEIYSMNVAGSGQTRLTNNAASDLEPAFSPDGAKIAFYTDRDGNFEIYSINADGTSPARLTNSPTEDRDPDWQPIPVNAYPRPKGATPLYAALVPAYAPCTAPNRQHGPSLASPSCNPPAQLSGELTVGTGDANGKAANSVGSLRLGVVVGDPVSPADEADITIAVSIADVYRRGSLADYVGELRARTPLRLSDRDNTPHPGGPGAGTVIDIEFAFNVPCASTADTAVGGTCALTTTSDTLVPGMAKEGRRSIWGLGQVRLDDGGADSDADTPGDNTPFMKQGIFVP